jgi:hypothetical protein
MTHLLYRSKVIGFILSLAISVGFSACSIAPVHEAGPVITSAPPPPPPEPTPVLAPVETQVLETQPLSPTEMVEPSIPLASTATRTYVLSAATRSLVTQATAQRKSRNFVQAAATLERALRIEPKNPLLWIEYGQLRMDENNYTQAESMGRKALASATGDLRTQSKAWLLIAESYKARNRNGEAQQAYERANTLSGF